MQGIGPYAIYIGVEHQYTSTYNANLIAATGIVTRVAYTNRN